MEKEKQNRIEEAKRLVEDYCHREFGEDAVADFTNITELKKNGTTICSYVYDKLNQLIRENNHILHCTENCPALSAQFNNILHKHQKRRFYQAALFLCLKKDSRIRAAACGWERGGCSSKMR